MHRVIHRVQLVIILAHTVLASAYATILEVLFAASERHPSSMKGARTSSIARPPQET